MSQAIPYPPEYGLEAELADKRYAAALARVTTYDVLAVFDAMVAAEPDPRRHPLYRLAEHVLTRGSYKRTGKPVYFSESIARVLEDWLDEAVEACIAEEMGRDSDD